MRITKKIGLLVAVPLVAAISFAALAASITGGQALQADYLRGLVDTSGAAGKLAGDLSAERASAVSTLTSDSSKASQSFAKNIRESDESVEEYKKLRAELDPEAESTEKLLTRIDTQLERLDSVRESVGTKRQTASSVAFVYRIVIADLLAYRDSVTQVGEAPAEVADELRAGSTLSRAIEFVGLQEVAVLRAGPGKTLTPSDAEEIAATRLGFDDAMLTFDRLTTTEWQTLVERAQIDEQGVAATKLERDIARIHHGEKLDVDPGKWTDLMDSRASALLKVEEEIDQDNSEAVTALRDAQVWVTIIETVAVTLAVIAAIILALWLGRPVVRGLRKLRDAAHLVASKELPDAVARLDDHEILGELTPEQFADAMDPPVKVSGKDELAEVGSAFNEVHREAVRVAAQQALLRLHIGSIFVNLARRGHALTGRLTAEIDNAESRELDPERLERLFTLDHLVTLLGRSNDSLLVLGGTSPAKVRMADEPLGDVLTASQSQIEQYTRIRMASIDTGLAVRAAIVDDVVKLLAELMDNATRYSQPEVVVDARALADRLIIQISDSGIGMEPAKMDSINARLATKPPLDLEAVRSMGLTVVGHIASRLGISVQLRVGHPRGTIAEVTMPAALLTADTRDSTEVAEATRRPAERRPEQTSRPVPRLFRDANTMPSRNTPVADDSALVPVVHFDKAHLMESTREHPVVPKPRNPFDDGWRAAEEASKPMSPPAEGQLPRRTPGNRLVPGGEVPDTIEGVTAQDHRDPAAISATYAAYARGRSNSGVSPLNTPSGSRSAS
ncbi:sensor histidine kinase [Stackebrandtia nassauensis]|uniref:sensor histidine kinase n=1 Tax=Stackebrandtia nassauensis TaxID=283811 RepID=UPI0002D50B78|nr:nitrate- and nitrite sensing domain-containing protein [Stackebrandtia nassauensis]